MRNLLFLIFVSCLLCLSVRGQAEYQENLKKIRIFNSTRRDVEKIFKYHGSKEFREYNLDPFLFPEDDREDLVGDRAGNYLVSYELSRASLDVVYSTGRCSKTNQRGYDLEKDTVIQIELRFDRNIALDRLGLDISMFTLVDKPYGDNPMLTDIYVNRSSGTKLETDGKKTDLIEVSASPFESERYGCPFPFPSDSDMEKRFREKRDVFEHLVQMSNEDEQVKIINSNFTKPITEATNDEHLSANPLPFSTERWNEYKTMFKEAGLKSGLSRVNKRHPVGIVFPAFHKSYWVASAEKGYIYTTGPLQSLVSSIDAVIIGQRDNETFFRKDQVFYKKIADNWYLYYEYH